MTSGPDVRSPADQCLQIKSGIGELLVPETVGGVRAPSDPAPPSERAA
ncbi:MAG: hypothetical protein L0I24_09040 [Pseudonocardia sp.]|nr:hypothetical protein [Pseudonocardia sp.]